MTIPFSVHVLVLQDHGLKCLGSFVTWNPTEVDIINLPWIFYLHIIILKSILHLFIHS